MDDDDVEPFSADDDDADDVDDDVDDDADVGDDDEADADVVERTSSRTVRAASVLDSGDAAGGDGDRSARASGDGLRDRLRRRRSRDVDRDLERDTDLRDAAASELDADECSGRAVYATTSELTDMRKTKA